MERPVQQNANVVQLETCEIGFVTRHRWSIPAAQWEYDVVLPGERRPVQWLHHEIMPKIEMDAVMGPDTVTEPLWRLSGSSDRQALDIVDGTGPWDGFGPHYSRRTPGSKTFTGVGQEIVLVREDAVWAVVRNRLPQPKGSGGSRGRAGVSLPNRFMWRCNMFRNLGPIKSSLLIREAVAMTAQQWILRYGELPEEDLQTEVQPSKIRTEIPGYCFIRAGWRKSHINRSRQVVFRCPRAQILRALDEIAPDVSLTDRLPHPRELALFDVGEAS